MTSLVQLRHPRHGRSAALVVGDALRLLPQFDSIYALAASALTCGLPLAQAARQAATGESLSYDAIHSGASPWRLLPAMDHPTEPARCMVAGTGLTHLQSAANRNAMHVAPSAQTGATAQTTPAAKPTDSMVMYQWGVEGGRPPAGAVGTSPEWFYKGTGTILRGHLEPLTVPAYACDGGEEAEVAGIYLIDATGTPRRLGFAAGNEFSDHVFEKKNYLYLASSKLRECSIGPELVLDASFDDLPGNVAIHRGSTVLWRKTLRTGEAAMCHSLANMEHHDFKFAPHRRPGDVHIHFFGAGAFSFGEGIQLEAGDVMEVSFDQLGRFLRNPLAAERGSEQLAVVQPL